MGVGFYIDIFSNIPKKEFYFVKISMDSVADSSDYRNVS